MDFVIELLVSVDWKDNNYDLILVIIIITKMVYYKLVKVTINIVGLTKVITNVLVYHHGFLDLIVTNKSSFFTSKFWLLLYYFFDIKQKLFITFYS